MFYNNSVTLALCKVGYIPYIAIPRIVFPGLHLEDFKDIHCNRSHDRILVKRQASQKAIECKVDFWYFIGDGDLDFEVVHWATPLEFVVVFSVGCSPFFILVQPPSRNFRSSHTI
jgi:hypothetical protein